MKSAAPRLKAVVFDLLFTLVHPGTYPGGTDRMGWLANILDVDVDALQRRWQIFEPVLEAGKAPGGADGTGPELEWVRAVAAELGVTVFNDSMSLIDADWDLTRRTALLDPPVSSLETLVALQQQGIRLGLLSNTHGLELRMWDQSPLAPLFDAVVLSHDAGVCKPERLAYASVLDLLGVPAAVVAYVGDGSSDELEGARAAGFGLVILADEAARRWATSDLSRLRAQADASVASLAELPKLIYPENGT